MTTPKTSSSFKRRWRYVLITLAACVLTIALFYAEEDWRGYLAKQRGVAAMQKQGLTLDWNQEIPLPVPEDENVFGIARMQKWFVGRGSNELSGMLTYRRASNTNRMIVAQLIIGLAGTSAPPGAATFQLGDRRAGAEAGRLIQEEFGPFTMDPTDEFFFTKEGIKNVRPVQIFLSCQSEPDKKAVEKFIPNPLTSFGMDSSIHPQVEESAPGIYDVTLEMPNSAADYVKWLQQFEPQFALIRQALHRPYARMNGNYSKPPLIPIPNFVTMRAMAQRLAAAAKCSLLLGQPDDALADLTLMHGVCRRVLEENKPMTLVSAMINVAVRGLDTAIISEGIQMHAWQEPQLAALQQQLASINVLAPVKQAFSLEQKSSCNQLAVLTPGQLANLYEIYGAKTGSWAQKRDTALFRLIPRGWVWQNMATTATLPAFSDCIDAESQIVFADKSQATTDKIGKLNSHWSPYTFISLKYLPNLNRACQTTAKNETEIHQTLIACALERYRVAHGEYPDSLDALVPQFLDKIPHDVIGGKTPHYSRNGEGFKLYSIGWDGLDHGGISGVDWVWPEK